MRNVKSDSLSLYTIFYVAGRALSFTALISMAFVIYSARYLGPMQMVTYFTLLLPMSLIVWAGTELAGWCKYSGKLGK